MFPTMPLSAARGLTAIARRHSRARNLIGWWRLDENAGPWMADAMHDDARYRLTWGDIGSNIAQWDTPSPLGPALHFVDTQQMQANFIETVPVFGLNTYPFTMSVWVRYESVGVEVTAMSFGVSTVLNRYVFLGATNTNTATFAIANTTLRRASSTATIHDGLWHHLVGVAAASNNRILYLDGVQAGTSTNTVSPVTLADQFMLGGLAWSSPGSHKWNGSIGEARLYTRALTDGEVHSLYTNPHLELEWAWRVVRARQHLAAGVLVAGQPRWLRGGSVPHLYTSTHARRYRR